MNAPHKHAECIKAWADGAQIQYKTPTCTQWNDCKDPSWILTWQYRIKPAIEIPEGFTPWEGGEHCPVHPKCMIEVVLRNGKRNKIPVSAGKLRWGHRVLDSCDIIAYKVVKNAPVVRWQFILEDKPSGQPWIPAYFFKDEVDVLKKFSGSTIIGKAEWSRTEFDE